MERTCSNCQKAFTTEKKRGRPHTKCESCRTNKKPTQLGAWNPEPKKAEDPKPEKKVRKFKDDPGKGNPRYSRAAFIQYMETHGVPKGAQAVAEAIRIVKEG